MRSTLLERVAKSKELYRTPSLYPHNLQELPDTEGLCYCTVCGGFEGTLLKDCPGYECSDILYDAYADKKFEEISCHWLLILNQAMEQDDDTLVEMIRNI